MILYKLNFDEFDVEWPNDPKLINDTIVNQVI